MADMRSIDEIAARQYGAISHDQLIESGFSSRQVSRLVARSHLVRVHRGVFRTAGAVDLWEHRLVVACLAAAPCGVASHRSAARLWAMRSRDADVEVSVRYPRQLSMPGVVVHRSCDLRDCDVTVVDGIPTTTPVRTLCDLGLIFPAREVSRMVDHALATGLVTRADLWRLRIELGRQGRNGVGVLHRLLAELPPQSADGESGPEVELMRICERFSLPRPVPQHVVVAQGRTYRLDFAYPRMRRYLEYDGYEVHSSAATFEADRRRQNDLVLDGWQPLRFVWSDLRERPERVASQIALALRDL